MTATSTLRRELVALVASMPGVLGCGGEVVEMDAAAEAPSLGGNPGAASGEGGNSRVCVPGAVQDCSGSGRCPGAQVCLQDGNGWGPCDCGSSSSGGAKSGGSPGIDGASSGGSPTVGGSSASGGVASSDGYGGFCSDLTVAISPLPPVLEFVIDTSGSMNDDAYPDDPNNNATKLAELQKILLPAFTSLPSDGAVGIEFFNYPEDSGCYHGRQAVAINPLDATQLAAINTAMSGVVATEYTPTYAAWLFGLNQVVAYDNPAYADSLRSIVLITDGVPTILNTGCAVQMPISQVEYDALINQVQANGMGGSPQVKTYVIGVLGSQDPQGATYDPLYELSLLAIAGGTGAPGCTPVSGIPSSNTVSPRGSYCHFDLTSNPDFATGLQTALSQILAGQIGCTYTVPPPPSDGRVFDLINFTLTYTPSAGVSRILGKAADASCVGGQWYVSAADANGNPTEVALCPETCAAAQSDPGATLKVTFPCSLLI